LVTNAHVVERAVRANVRFGRSSQRLRAQIVGRNPATDLAVLKVDPAKIKNEEPLELAPAESVHPGDPVLAVGTPYRLQGSNSAGIVSATGREIVGLSGYTIPDAVQTDAAINPGNSGGPLVDARGRVIGVNTQGRAAGVSFAVGSTTVRRIVPQLIEDGTADNAYMGVASAEISERGTRLESVSDGGPADKAGLQAGDLVTAIEGRPMTTEGALAAAVAARKPSDRVTVTVRRGGRTRVVTVTLGRQPRS
jgi:S1-C subfamily serine protease